MIDIFDYNGSVLLHLYNDDDIVQVEGIAVPLNSGSVYHHELMSNDYIKVKFTLQDPITIKKGSYIKNDTIGGLSKNNSLGWFILCTDAQPSYNESTGGYDYELQFDAWYYSWNRYVVKLNPQYGAKESSFPLTDKIEGHFAMLKKNIDAYFAVSGLNSYNGVELKCVFDNSFSNTYKAVTYDNVRIVDALSSIAETFGCEWWIEDNTIHFGKCTNYGKTERLALGQELASLSRSDSSDKFATRLYAFGSTRNIPLRYRKKLIFDVKETGVANGGYDSDGLAYYGKRNYVLDTARIIQPSLFDSKYRVEVETLRYVLFPAILTTSVSGRNRNNFTITSYGSDSTPYSLDKVDKGLVMIAPSLQAFFTDTTKGTLEIVVTGYTGPNPTGDPVFRDSFDVIESQPAGTPGNCMIVASHSNAKTFNVPESCYLFLSFQYKLIGTGDKATFLTNLSNFGVSNKNYIIKTKLYALDVDDNVTRTLDVVVNALAEDVYDRNAARIFLTGNDILAKGTRFELDGIILGQVSADKFTNDDDVDATITSFERRLMLPKDRCPNNYVDAWQNMPEAEIVEQIAVFDDIYPKKEIKISSIKTYETQEKLNEDENGNTTRTVTHYKILVDKDKFWLEQKYLSKDELSIVFQTGKLAGMEFGVTFEGDVSGTNYQAYDIKINDNYGTELPNDILNPLPDANGEYPTVVFVNYDTSLLSDEANTLVASAENELYDKAVKLLTQISKDCSTYTAVLMSDYAYGLDANGTQDRQYGKIFGLGDSVELIHAGYFGDGSRVSRIIGVELKLDVPYDSPSYTIGESAAFSRLNELEGKIDEVNTSTIFSGGGNISNSSAVDIKTSSSTKKSTDSNVYSALASDKNFLSKKKDDTAKGRITLEKGLVSDQDIIVHGQTRSDSFATNGFVTGMSGTGGRIQSDGAAELESLMLRSFLEVPELRFNRVDVVSGELWNSIAFGTIESVTVNKDGRGGVAWIHLEQTEKCGLHVGDICRGIFADFGDGKPTDEGEDNNGFQKTYGFSTAYFTPTSIVRNEEGKFCFTYSIQPGSTVHPCAFMKFAVYGSFSDSSRRASAYMTRTYMRYLKGVDTWFINPDKHIASQFGNLNGLEIGGMRMHGEGTFLSNIYMTGAMIQFTPEQKEQIKGQDAYSVVLSDYEAVLHVDSEGNVKDIRSIRNVVVSEGNVMAIKNRQKVNVVDLGYSATTTIQVYKGQELMHHAAVIGELAYIVKPVFFNCTGFVTNGVLMITAITDPKTDAYVDLEVNCEGFAVFQKHFAVTVIEDATSPVVADLDNEMETVVENPLSDTILGSPITTKAIMRYGTDEMQIVNMTAKQPLPEGITCDIDEATATISVAKNAQATSNLVFTVVGKTEMSETLHTREVKMTINKVKSQYQLKLVPACAEVKTDADGKFNGADTARVKCQLLVNDGASSSTAASYAEVMGYKARMFYALNSTSAEPDFTTGEVTEDVYQNGVSVNSSSDSVTFWVYYYPNGIDTDEGCVKSDMETIHVLHDAAESITSMVFKRSNEDSVSAPEASEGSFTNPVPTGWSDGIPSGKAKVWMTMRRFTSNGKNQDAAWTTPCQLSDTADFDVCFHDATPNDAKPSEPTTHHQEIQGDGWYNTAKATSQWMATASCKNGTWSSWNIVKIKGEKGDPGDEGESPVIADLDNEMDSIITDSDGNFDGEATLSTNVSMYYGTTKLTISSVDFTSVTGVTSNHSNGKCTFSVTKEVANKANVVITLKAKHNGTEYSRDLNFTIIKAKAGAKGANAVVYSLVVDHSSVVIYKNDSYSASKVSAKIVKSEGGVTTEVSKEEAETKNLSIYHSFNFDGSTWEQGSVAFLDSTRTYLHFKLMYNGSEIDREQIPIIREGKDGKAGSSITGPRGQMARYRGEWVSGTTYYGSSDQSSSYVDVVYNNGVYYQCLTTNSDSKFTSSKWQGSLYKFVATDVLFAKTASINNLALNYAAAGRYNESSGDWIEKTLEIKGDTGRLTAKEASIEGTLTTQRNGFIVSQYNGNGNGTIVYYYPIKKKTAYIYKRASYTPSTPSEGTFDKPAPSGWDQSDPKNRGNLYMSTRVFWSNNSGNESWTTPTKVDSDAQQTTVEQIKMREETFIYDASGNVTGMRTYYYKNDGTMSWYIDEGGNRQDGLTEYWSTWRSGFYSDEKNSIEDLAKWIKNNAQTSVPSSNVGMFSTFHASSSSKVAAYSGLVAKNVQSGSSPDKVDFFTGFLFNERPEDFIDTPDTPANKFVGYSVTKYDKGEKQLTYIVYLDGTLG